MKIGILGAGNMGTALGKLWAAQSHEVCFGVRQPVSEKSAKRLAALGASIEVGSLEAAAKFGEVVLIAVPWEATEEVVCSVAPHLAGRVLIDCTNPITPNLGGLVVGHETSAAEEIARWAPQANVVKCFNTVGAGGLHDARYGDHSASVLLCGDDEAAKQAVTQLAEGIGFEVIDAGPLAESRYIEPLALLWIHLAMRGKYGSKIAVKLLRR